MNAQQSTITKAQFDRVFAEIIVGRTFVENLEYYKHSRKRFWIAFQQIAALGLAQNARVLDIGGGIMAVLLKELLGMNPIVGDVVEDARVDIEALGLEFITLDLFRDTEPSIINADLVVLQEVIEHIPQPPYLVMRRLAGFLKPGGVLFLTTPNGHRFRNLIYLLLGKEILDIYRYPEPGEALGHQHEYTLKQMLWQAGKADYEVISAGYFELGFSGSTPALRLVRFLIRPLNIISYWRDNIIMSLRRPKGARK